MIVHIDIDAARELPRDRAPLHIDLSVVLVGGTQTLSGSAEVALE
jgi:hypothetical protein